MKEMRQQMKFKILVKNPDNRIFTYHTDKYVIEDIFIVFLDNNAVTRKVNKINVLEIIGDE